MERGLQATASTPLAAKDKSRRRLPPVVPNPNTRLDSMAALPVIISFTLNSHQNGTRSSSNGRGGFAFLVQTRASCESADDAHQATA